MSAKTLAQEIVDTSWPRAPQARRAWRRGAWTEFVDAAAPAKPVIIGRRDHARCRAVAATSNRGPSMTQLTLVPLWGWTSSEHAAGAWVAVHAVAREGRPLEALEAQHMLADASPRADSLWECTVLRWMVGTVVATQDCAPSLELRWRAGAYGVVVVPVYEVLSVDVRASEPVRRPTREVPISSRWLEPRVKVAADLEAQIDALCHTARGA
jgi:hypothetical protein